MNLWADAILERESQNHKGSRGQPLGGGMLGNFQQNSRILILCIYCSDITNTLVGISGETGTVVRISMFIE